MSLTWPLELACHRSARLTIMEFGNTLGVEIAHNFGATDVEFHEDEARRLRDWLSWYLGEGPEPGAA